MLAWFSGIVSIIVYKKSPLICLVWWWIVSISLNTLMHFNVPHLELGPLSISFIFHLSFPFFFVFHKEPVTTHTVHLWAPKGPPFCVILSFYFRKSRIRVLGAFPLTSIGACECGMNHQGLEMGSSTVAMNQISSYMRKVFNILRHWVRGQCP